MQRSEFTIPSSEGTVRLHGIHWVPEGEIKGVLQMVHGMVEHSGRYEELAAFMAAAGYAVIGHDHLGHGASLSETGEQGYFADSRGDACLVKDMHRVTVLAKRLHPDVPVFILGHSMGSFLLRRYLTVYGGEVSGAIICGTGDYSLRTLRVANALAKHLEKKRGRHGNSLLLDFLVIGVLAGQFGNPVRPGSWLSKNTESVKNYREDPRCGFSFKIGAYQDFFHLLTELAERKDFDRIPRDLPVLLASGMDDPLGGYTKKVLQVYNRYVALGMQDVDIYLYPDDRHEILNELDRAEVHQDILDWIEKRRDAE